MTLLEMIKRREKTKREHVHLGIEIFEKRYQAKDFNGCLLNEFTNNAVKSSRYVSIKNGNYLYWPIAHNLLFLCYFTDRPLHHYMETSIQVNSQINIGPILAIQRAAIQHRY